MDSNRVMVLDKGQIAEFDSPSNLLADTKSIFYGMAKSGKWVLNNCFVFYLTPLNVSCNQIKIWIPTLQNKMPI